ncbi:hypothetical protein QE390_001221 [Siphonobacter sp. SORGH_AS 1065]|nr:hypothetical protein [Siphonobacter sp. SORGH_AS_1065]
MPLIMKSLPIISALFMIVFSLTSCVKESDDIIIENDPKLVVECYLNPTDTDITAIVNENRPIDGPGSGDRGQVNPILNATVFLSDGNREVQLTNAKNNTYTIAASRFALVAGRTYTLKVTAPGLPATEATCTIPRVPSALSAKDSELTYERDQTSTYKVYRKRSLSWTNTQTKATQYYLVGSGEGSAYKVKAASGDSTCIKLKNAEVVAFLNENQAAGATYSTQTLNFLVGHASSATDTKITSTAPRYSFVYHVDKNYYEFYRTIKRQREVGDNPFAEAMPVYSNIKNGLGVFGAYVTQVKSL